MTSVAAIVVSYETRDLLARCLAALRREGVDTIVVDNASRDGSAELVREHFPEVRLAALQKNIGFGSGCNLGAGLTDSTYILLLNPDAEPKRDAIQALVRCCAASGRIGAAVPRLVDEHARESASALGYPTKWWRGAPPVTSFPTRRRGTSPGRGTLQGEFAIGAALLLRREAFEQVDGFDPGFFLFYEEVDLCRRLQAQGWDITRCPSSEVEHLGGASTRKVWSMSYQEQLRGHLRFLVKHEGRRAAAISRLVLLASVLLRYVVARGERRRGFRAGIAWLATVDLDDVGAPAPPQRLVETDPVVGRF